MLLSSNETLLVLTSDPVTHAVVQKAAAGMERMRFAEVCSGTAALAARLAAMPMPVVLVDADPEPTHVLTEVEPLIARFPSTRFVLLCGRMEHDLLIEAMQVGFRHVQVKSAIEAELPGLLQRLLLGGSSRGSMGKIVTVLSAAGGCGATTVAINLAGELSSGDSNNALLVDLDCWYGSVATFLGLKGSYGVADVLARGTNVDAQLVTTSATPFTDRMQVLLSPASVDFTAPEPLQWEHLPIMLEACRQAYSYCIVDAPRIPLSAVASLAKASRATLLVLQLTVKDIGNARNIRSALISRGVQPNRIIPVVNRYNKRKALVPLEECKRALGVEEAFCLSNDYRSAGKGITEGRLLSKVAASASLRKDIRKLADLPLIRAASVK